MSDIIDRIDELVDESLTAGESCSDYMNNDPEYPRCPHCNRHWHGLRITQRIEDMRYRGRYDEDYSIASDDSAVLCEGSDFIGPQRPPANSWSDSWLGVMPGWSFLGFINDELYTTPRREVSFSVQIGPNVPVQRLQFNSYQYAWEQMHSIVFPRWTLHDSNWNTLWTVEPEPEPEPCTVDVVVEFGPQNWKYEFQRIPNHTSWCYIITPNTQSVARLWDKFTAPDYPVPVAPGLDLAALEATITPFSGTGPELPPLRQRGRP